LESRGIHDGDESWQDDSFRFLPVTEVKMKSQPPTTKSRQDYGRPVGKAVEGYRSPRRFARHDDFQMRGASWTAPALWSFFPWMTFRMKRGVPISK
jgi:hypothetical protein